MRLKTKIVGSAILVMLLFSIAFSFFVLWRSRQDTISRVEELQKSIFEAKVREVEKGSFLRSQTFHSANTRLQRDIVLYYTRKNMVGTYAVYENGQEIYNTTSFSFEYNPKQEDVYSLDSQIFEDGVQKVLVLYTGFSIWDNKYVFYQTIDISELYETSLGLFYQGIGIAVLFCLVMGAILYYVIQKILGPFYKLKTAAIEIEEGNYEKRVAISQKDEIGEVADRFNRMAGTIQEKIEFLTEMNERQNLMIGSIAHELKTPMTAMIGYSDTLLRMNLKKEQQDKALAYIGKECHRLVALSGKIMELMDLNKEASVIEQKRIPVMKLVENVKEATEAKRKERQIQLVIIDEGIGKENIVEGDETLLTSLLINLVDNAIKASEEYGEITILLEEMGVTVIDQGIGIPSNELPRITEPFYMVDKSRSRNQGGVGLGLSLCRQIAVLHAMELNITSRQGEGTRAALIYNSVTK